MGFDKMKKEYDLLRIVKFVGIFLVIILTVSISVCTIAISSISNETSNYADSVVLSYVRETKQLLKNIDRTMVSEVIYDSNLETIQLNKGNTKDIYATRSVKNMLISLAHSYAFPINYLVYFEDTGEEITGSISESEYNEWREIGQDIIKVVTKNLAYQEYSNVGDWNAVKINKEGYIIKYYKYNGRYICSWIKINDLFNIMVMEGLGEQCYYVLSNELGQAYNNQDLLKTDKIKLTPQKNKVSYTTKLFSNDLLISEPIEGTSFYLNAVIKNYSGTVNILRLQIILTIVVGLITIACLAALLYLRNRVIKPIQNFSDNIKKIRNDNNYSVETHYQINELKNVSELLADMVNQINGLKIDIYERTLEKQKIKLDFFSVQIQPHFFINCLNIIYNMIQVGKYKETQHMIECISDYMRYILKNEEKMVEFNEELGHIKKYLEIQKIRYRDAFVVELDIEDEILKVKIPPLSIQTFIENAIKYTIDWDEEIKITLKAKKIMIGEEEYMIVVIEDSGEGFDPEILDKLQNQIPLSEDGKRIGIMNTIERLKLQFGEKARTYFYNRDLGGAGIRIEIPIHN